MAGCTEEEIWFSQCAFPALLITNPDNIINPAEKNLAVTNLSCARGIHDRLDRLFSDGIGQHKLKFGLRDQVDGIFLATVKLSVAFLATVAADLKHGHSLHSDLVESVFDCVEF